MLKTLIANIARKAAQVAGGQSVKSCLAAIVIPAFVLSPSAFALEEAHTGPYFGGGAQIVKIRDYCSNVRAQAAAVVATAVSCDDTQVGFRIFGGLQFTENFGVEAGYLMANGFTDKLTGVGFTESTEADYSTIHFALTGMFPLTENIGVTAKAGMHKWESEGSVTYTDGSVFSGGNDDTDPFFGAGARVRVSDNFILSGELTRFKGDGFDVDTFSLNAAYAF